MSKKFDSFSFYHNDILYSLTSGLGAVYVPANFGGNEPEYNVAASVSVKSTGYSIGRPEPMIYGKMPDNDLKMVFDIIKSPCEYGADARYITNEDIKTVTQVLTDAGVIYLTVVSTDGAGDAATTNRVSYNGYFSDIKSYVAGGNIVGLSLEFTSIVPYAEDNKSRYTAISPSYLDNGFARTFSQSFVHRELSDEAKGNYLGDSFLLKSSVIMDGVQANVAADAFNKVIFPRMILAKTTQEGQIRLFDELVNVGVYIWNTNLTKTIFLGQITGTEKTLKKAEDAAKEFVEHMGGELIMSSTSLANAFTKSVSMCRLILANGTSESCFICYIDNDGHFGLFSGGMTAFSCSNANIMNLAKGSGMTNKYSGTGYTINSDLEAWYPYGKDILRNIIIDSSDQSIISGSEEYGEFILSTLNVDVEHFEYPKLIDGINNLFIYVDAHPSAIAAGLRDTFRVTLQWNNPVRVGG